MTEASGGTVGATVASRRSRFPDGRRPGKESLMSHVAVMARFRAKEGRMEELLEALRPLLDQADDEPGTLVYAMNRSTKEPDVLFFYELYSDRDAFHAHARTETMAAAGPVLEELVAESEMVVGDPVRTRGLPE
jgi:autoinducer 2-degrading protein